jgi:hypothetical protein
VDAGGGDEGGDPLPGLRGESQEAHLQNGRYVWFYSLIISIKKQVMSVLAILTSLISRGAHYSYSYAHIYVKNMVF